MKKIVLLGTVLAFAAQAEESSVTRPAELEGFYVGLGVCWNHTINKIKVNEFNEIGVGYGWFACNILSKGVDKVGGTFTAGYGKFVHDCVYLGGEATFDITRSETTNGVSERNWQGNNLKFYACTKGFIPTIAMRLGEYCPSIGILPYIRLGIAFVRAEFQLREDDTHNDIPKMNKIAPVIGVGIEKNICGHFNFRIEGDYRFQVKKEGKTWTDDFSTWMASENRVKGFTIRMMGTYKF